jgi:DNA-binding CsgD family transcriptional regulator
MNSVVIGREREIAEARSLLDDAAQRPCGLLLVGEAGIGKTTIWGAAVDEAESRGYTVLVARPAEAETELAFAGLTDLVAPVESDVLAELPAAQRTALEDAVRRREHAARVDPTAVALAVLGVLRLLSDPSPLVVAVDDVQWLDAPSLRALTYALRRLDNAPMGLVATVRDGHENELTRQAGRIPHVRRIGVDGLGEREIAQLVRERTGRSLTPTQLRRLVELSAGNPYYALELAAHDDADLVVPPSLSVAIRSRLSELSDAARSTALNAAILGRFEETMSERITRPGLDELRAAGVIDVRSDVLRFAHPLLASTLLEMHTAEERRAVHVALAGVLADPDERALHLARGTNDVSREVAAELEDAAARLDARGAPETAAMLVERAAALTPPDDDDAATRRLIKAADMYQVAGEANQHVLPLLERLVDILPPGADRARVLMRIGWLGALVDTIPTAEVLEYQERALGEAGGARDVVGGAHAVLARMVGIGGDYRSALRHAELAVAAGAAPPTNLMFPSPHGELAIASFFTGRGLDENLFELGIASEASNALVGEPYQSSKRQLAVALLHTGELGRARPLLLELLAVSSEHERIRSIAGCLLHLVELEVRAGNVGTAERYAGEFAHLDRQLRGELSEEWYPSGLVAMHLGRVDDARRILLAGIFSWEGIGATIWLAHHLDALGQLELSLGNHAAAREALERARSIMRTAGLQEWQVHPFLPDLIETLVELGELDEAAALTAELEEYGRRLDRPWGLATGARSAALVASARGDHDRALELADSALDHHARLSWPFECARTIAVRGSILRRLGRRRDAGATLQAARSAFAELRNPVWQARVEAEASRLGGRPRSDGELTPTETRVAELAGQGLRNAEIAARLFVTPKTVEATLSRVYRKLGVRSRTELAGRVAPPKTS